jgi:signal peptidase II
LELRKFFNGFGLLAGMAVVIIALDQWTKWLVRTNLPLEGVWAPIPWLAPYARIVHWNNTGAAFGILHGYSGVFTALAVVVAILIIAFFPQVPKEDWIFRVALGFQLGGALGNLIDRLTIGHVVDFISVGTFPVFNVADSCITIGVILLLAGVWLKEAQEARARKNAAQTNEETGAVGGAEGERGE